MCVCVCNVRYSRAFIGLHIDFSDGLILFLAAAAARLRDASECERLCGLFNAGVVFTVNIMGAMRTAQAAWLKTVIL